MAKIEIESAFVEFWSKNDEQHPSWGMKTAEPHSRKNTDTGKYETISRTYRTIKIPRDSGIDLTEFRKGDRVSVWGREVTVERTYLEKKYYDLVVWADRVEIVKPRDADRTYGQQSPAQQSQAPAGEPWAATPQTPAGDVWNTPGSFNDETPF